MYENSLFDWTKRSSSLMSENQKRREDSLILTSKLKRSLPIAALTFALGIVMTPAAAQSPAEFYKGKTITIMVHARACNHA
jgi:hypothetical protein